MTYYSKKSHTVFYHRYHIVWITKYRYKVLTYDIKKRVREIVLQVAEEMGIKVENGVVSSDHVHIFVEIHPISKLVNLCKKQKDVLLRKFKKSSQFSGKNTGVEACGEEAILVQRAVMLQTI